MFASLYNSLEANRVTACVQQSGARACAGLAWQRRWLIFLLYTDITTQSTIATANQCTHHVVAFYKHPTYPEQDLALLQLDWPFISTKLINNHTINGNIIKKLDDWMKKIKLTEAVQYQTTWGHNRSYHKMYSTPVRMFLVTVVLPSASFIVFFLFIIFFTGNKTRGNKIPYRNLNNENKETTYV
ncbi:uncharacterized protein LOC126770871 [Nymphalis io]|uniref:uncharacterized protein LOC126770871 n=1 Tax=Inachis io TaxID=171585 RepID=UPI0021670F78|nr:uncharacterized protein LOC126770871 [Nymphalis io]